MEKAEQLMDECKAVSKRRVDEIRDIVPTLEKWDKALDLIETLFTANIAAAHSMKKVATMIGEIHDRIDGLERP
jgi:hypothetical protein